MNDSIRWHLTTNCISNGHFYVKNVQHGRTRVSKILLSWCKFMTSDICVSCMCKQQPKNRRFCQTKFSFQYVWVSICLERYCPMSVHTIKITIDVIIFRLATCFYLSYLAYVSCSDGFFGSILLKVFEYKRLSSCKTHDNNNWYLLLLSYRMQ